MVLKSRAKKKSQDEFLPVRMWRNIRSFKGELMTDGTLLAEIGQDRLLRRGVRDQIGHRIGGVVKIGLNMDPCVSPLRFIY